MHFLLGLVFCLTANIAFAGEESLIGSWEGGDTAAMSIYGTLHISKETIWWSGYKNRDPKCKVTYVIQPEKLGVTFEDQTGNIFVTSKESKFSTYLLKISGGECAAGVSYFRLTFPFEKNFSYLAMIEYDESGKSLGWIHFHRRDTKPQ